LSNKDNWMTVRRGDTQELWRLPAVKKVGLPGKVERIMLGTSERQAVIWSDGKAALWNLMPVPKMVMPLPADFERGKDVDVHDDAGHLVLSSYNGPASVWDVRGPAAHVLVDLGLRVRSVEETEDGKWIKVINADRSATLWDLTANPRPLPIELGPSASSLWFESGHARVIVDHVSQRFVLSIVDLQAWRPHNHIPENAPVDAACAIVGHRGLTEAEWRGLAPGVAHIKICSDRT
jgi:hypothetical protein